MGFIAACDRQNRGNGKVNRRMISFVSLRYVRAAALLTLCCTMLGCGVQQGEILVRTPASPRWPEEPNKPHIVFLGQIATQADLRPAVSGWKRFSGILLGRKPPGAIVSPQGLLVDDAGRLLVADPEGRCIHSFGLVDRKYERIDLSKVARGPVGVATDVQGRLYVTDPEAAAVLVLDYNGNLLREIGSPAMTRPTGVAFSEKNSLIYVSDTGSHQVFAFDLQGVMRLGFGELGSKGGQFNFPTMLCAHGDRILICDTFNFRVQEFDLAGKFISSIGKEGNRPGMFSQPRALAVDSANHVWVVDGRFENIQAFDESGGLLMALGGEGTGPGQFWLPSGVFIDQSDRMFVSDSYNRRVQVFQLLIGEE